MTSVKDSVNWNEGLDAVKEMFKNISNAFVGLIYDMGGPSEDVTDPEIRSILKDDRYIYLSILVILLVLIGNVFFT